MQRRVFSQKFFSIPDGVILLLVGTAIYGLVSIGKQWRAEFNPVTEISLSVPSLLYYTLLSGIRGSVAYLLSLGFTLVVGYAAAKNKAAERIIIPMLDILQSIPVLGFLPGLMLGLVALFPRTNTGLELAAIIMIFTGQVWNMTFSYYASLKSIPSDFIEASTVMGLNWRQRLSKVELPFSAVNLAWNSLMSMAGGWFFLNVCEAGKFGEHEYRLPGIGSYMAVATAQGDRRAMALGIAAMVGLIVVMDFLIWRPVLAWVQRFRLEDVPGVAPEEPLMQIVLRESRIVREVKLLVRRYRFEQAHEAHLGHAHAQGADPATSSASSSVSAGPLPALEQRTRQLWHQLAEKRRSPYFGKALGAASYAAMLALLAYGSWLLLGVLLKVPVQSWIIMIRNTTWTFVRVLLSIALSTLWAVPAGIWLGTSSRRIRVAQPIIQVLASFPAPMLYPIALAVLFALGISFDWGSMFLMFLGVQWYVLFNVLAGALRVPRELKDALDLMEAPTWDQWKTLYIPSVFPALVTGWVTAAGGAWNASMVAEMLTFRGQDLKTSGLGASITEATNNGDFAALAASLTIMVFVVILLNRVVWAPVYRLAQTRYRMD